MEVSKRAAAAQVVDQHGGVAFAALDHRDEVGTQLERQPNAADLHVYDPIAGKYTVEAWHSKYGLKTAQVTVEPNKTAEAKFSYDGTEKAE